MDEELTVRFRVGGVYKNCYVSAYFGDERVIHRKRPVVAPGEMEELKLKSGSFEVSGSEDDHDQDRGGIGDGGKKINMYRLSDGLSSCRDDGRR